METNTIYLQKALRALLYSAGLQESTSVCNNLPKILKYNSITVNVTHYREYVLTKDKHTYRISWPIRCNVIFSLEILEKNNDECILILVIYWKKTELLYIITKK
jgi:hypothetical protein